MDDFIALRSEDINLAEHKYVSPDTGNIMFQQFLVVDDDTGMYVKKILYPKGCITPLHTHHCAHGMYVLKGTLHTDKGDFGPGSFVWFKEGTQMTHGGLDEDVECLFITNKTFDINYL